MTERDPIERRLLLARTATWAPEAAKARVRANLASNGGALSAASGARAGGVTKLTTALLVGASFVAGYWLGFQRSAEPAAASAPIAAATVGAPPASALAEPARSEESARPGQPAEAEAASRAVSGLAPDAPRATAPRRSAPSPRATAHHPERATPGRALLARAPAASSDPAGDELALLSRAERAIRSGEPALALSFLDELEARFPRSILLEERTAARLLADCALSNPGSRRRAELFLGDRAASVYTDRVRRSCGLETPAVTDPSPVSPAADGSFKSGH